MNEKLKTIRIIHIAITAGLIIAYFIIGKLNSLDNLRIPSLNTSSIVFLVIPIVALFLSNYLFKSQLKSVDPTKRSFDDMYPRYLAASLSRWAVLEGAALMILFYNKDYLIFGILIIIYLVLLMPTENRIRRDIDNLR